MPPQKTPTETCAPSQLLTEPASASHLHCVGGAESYKEAPKLVLVRAVNEALFFSQALGTGEDTACCANKEGPTRQNSRHGEQGTASDPTYLHTHMVPQKPDSYTHHQHTSSTWARLTLVEDLISCSYIQRHTSGTYVHAQGPHNAEDMCESLNKLSRETRSSTPSSLDHPRKEKQNHV